MRLDDVYVLIVISATLSVSIGSLQPVKQNRNMKYVVVWCCCDITGSSNDNICNNNNNNQLLFPCVVYSSDVLHRLDRDTVLPLLMCVWHSHLCPG